MVDCRITEGTTKGIPSITLENQLIRVVVLAGKGTDIYEFRYKPTDTDVLWKTPWGEMNPQASVQDVGAAATEFMDSYRGGWQELFPNAGDGCSYKGAPLGFHGEICKLSWNSEITETAGEEVSVRFWVRTVRTPFLVEKRLRIKKDKAVLFLEESVTNQGSQTMDFMWGHHPAFGAPFLSEHCRLFIPATAVETALELPARQILFPGRQFQSFPIVKTADGRDFDLSLMLPPTARVTNFTYLTGLTDGWYCLVNLANRLGFAMQWDVGMFPYVWLWQEFCGTSDYPWWGNAYVVGVEPHSSIPAYGLQKALERGTQLTLPAGQTLSTRLSAGLFLAEAEPKGVSVEGEVMM